jgi:alpha-beta hydrolase superfamily lysophospholipase
MKKVDWGSTRGTNQALKDIDYFVKKLKAEAQQNSLPLFIWGHSMVFPGCL